VGGEVVIYAACDILPHGPDLLLCASYHESGGVEVPETEIRIFFLPGGRLFVYDRVYFNTVFS
jgi:hypothetical protein